MMKDLQKRPAFFSIIILSIEPKQCRIRKCSVIFTEMKPMKLTNHPKMYLQIPYTCRTYYAYSITQLDMLNKLLRIKKMSYGSAEFSAN